MASSWAAISSRLIPSIASFIATRVAAPSSNDVPKDDVGAARLVAMKFALDGTSRDEARKQLAADYDVADLDSLLDEVYSKAGK